MATLTAVDIDNAFKYATHMHRLTFIPRWRTKVPNIFIRYEIRPATNDDYYVPRSLLDNALAVRLEFSEKGCNSISCYPFDEFGPIDFKTPTGYTQTSDVQIQYAQPACYHLNRAAATREGAENEVQAPELRYAGSKCILVDTLSKMYLNSPYLRTDEHLIQGVDDVPGFNVINDPDPLFPERFKGTFNEAYCRRFGRDLVNGGCSTQWWESLIGFVLGDTIYITFKMLANNIFSELRDFDYTRPSPILPAKRPVDSERILREWQNARDAAVDTTLENEFFTYSKYSDINISSSTKLIYESERGYSFVPFTRRNIEFRIAEPSSNKSQYNSIDEATLEDIISQFLEDYSLIFGIATSVGFDLLFDQLKAMLKKINSALIPAMKQLLLNTSKRVTTRILGETYKAAVAHSFNRIAIKTISIVAKALTKITIKAASVVGIILIIFTISDLILAFWDPFGYNNMFPREFPDDLSRAFLAAFFESISDGSLEMIEWLPEYFDELVEEDNEAMVDYLKHTFDYVTSLEVNSNGQLLELDVGEAIHDFDEVSLVGSALASSALYTRLDFLQYTARHNKILYGNSEDYNEPENGTSVLIPSLCIFAALILLLVMKNHSGPENDMNSNVIVSLFIVFLLLALYLFIKDSLSYYLKLRSYTDKIQDKWFDNLYN
ncbi:P74 [Rachiplusia nu nucleopolyhedrovirus]|uniref:P74 n=1 Tax=Rachiplusia nu nucleopolyhedrovirus TaxID=2605775 RepID=A0AAE6IQL2_9ABAC|nr:P74 [Rachiplusia nu nucleopolyhedrovirus]QEI03585.1 P74 [Rachiplusia nu nucleopolyhedrovirus]